MIYSWEVDSLMSEDVSLVLDAFLQHAGEFEQESRNKLESSIKHSECV